MLEIVNCELFRNCIYSEDVKSWRSSRTWISPISQKTILDKEKYFFGITELEIEETANTKFLRRETASVTSVKIEPNLGEEIWV
jgi:hypothetical protein